MYDHTLKVDQEILADTQTLPQNTSADGNGGGLQISDTLGGIEVELVCDTDISIADTKNITIKLQQSSDDGDQDAYADLVDLYNVTASGAAHTVSAKAVMERFVIPTDAKKYIKAVLSTDDAAATGAVSVLPRYLPR